MVLEQFFTFHEGDLVFSVEDVGSPSIFTEKTRRARKRFQLAGRPLTIVAVTDASQVGLAFRFELNPATGTVNLHWILHCISCFVPGY